jgi:NAD-dependent deacetylase
MPTSPSSPVEALIAAKRVVVITGAGLSEPSIGLPLPASPGGDFHYDWTPQGFAADVPTAWEDHLDRVTTLLASDPNPLHSHVAAMGRHYAGRAGGHFLLATQNQDRLHERADPSSDSRPYDIIELHGDLLRARCVGCEHVFDLPSPRTTDPLHYNLPEGHEGRLYVVCPNVNCRRSARPNVRWLGEPYLPGTLNTVGNAVKRADLVLFLGTSGNVLAVRWMLHEAKKHARAYVAVLTQDAAPWEARDPGLIDAVISGDMLNEMNAWASAVGW